MLLWTQSHLPLPQASAARPRLHLARLVLHLVVIAAQTLQLLMLTITLGAHLELATLVLTVVSLARLERGFDETLVSALASSSTTSGAAPTMTEGVILRPVTA